MTVAEAVRKYVSNHPFIEEGLTDGIINLAGLARRMQRKISDQCGREVQAGAIIMGLRRLSPNYYYQVSSGIKRFLNKLGHFNVRYDISDYTFENSPTLIESQAKIFKYMASHPQFFYSYSQGLSESTIVASEELGEQLLHWLNDEKLITQKSNLAALSIMLPQENTEISGIYYFIFKQLAWQDINIVEVISTTHEITLVVSDQDVERSFRLIRALKKM